MLSFGEIAVIVLVALVVLGPEKTHRLVKQVGRWVGRSRAYLRNLGEELEREADAGDALRELRELRDQAGELRKNVVNLQHEMNDVSRKIIDAKDKKFGLDDDAPAALEHLAADPSGDETNSEESERTTDPQPIAARASNVVSLERDAARDTNDVADGGNAEDESITGAPAAFEDTSMDAVEAPGSRVQSMAPAQVTGPRTAAPQADVTQRGS